jgi:hypothetical protein
MQDPSARKSLAFRSETDLELFHRLTTRYSNTVLEHARLTGRLNLAVRLRDFASYAMIRQELEDSAHECHVQYAALQLVKEMIERSAPDDSAAIPDQLSAPMPPSAQLPVSAVPLVAQPAPPESSAPQ